RQGKRTRDTEVDRSPRGVTTFSLLEAPSSWSQLHCQADGVPGLAKPLSDHDPIRLKEQKGDQTQHGSRSHQQRIAHLPPKQNTERRDADENSEPVANCDTAEKNACTENGPNRSAVSTLHETLDIRVRPMPHQDRCGHQHVDEGRQEY